jgi:hypothetical protein
MSDTYMPRGSRDAELQQDAATLALLVQDTGFNTKHAVISGASAGNNTVLSAVAGKKFHVYHLTVVVNAAVGVKFVSGTTDLTGVMSFSGQGEGFSESVTPPAELLVSANAGEAFIMNLSGAVQVSGFLSYWEE